MCRRIGLVTDIADVKACLEAGGELVGRAFPSADVEPGQAAPVVRYDAGHRRMEKMRWGLIPRSAPNAIVVRSTLDVRECAFPAQELNDALSRRCLIPIDYFDEQRAKARFRVVQAEHRLMTLAGVWDDWVSPGGAIFRCFAIVTTVPNTLLQTICDRMPVIISSPARELWLNNVILDANAKAQLFQPPADDQISVSSREA